MGKKWTAKDVLAKLSSKSCADLDVVSLDTYEKLDIENGTIDTNSATLNAIICGSANGGVPIGRTTGLYGPSGCGKSYIVGMIIANAQKKGIIPILIDTENAWNGNAESFGIDISECLKVRGSIIEEVRNDVVKLIKQFDNEIMDGDVSFMVVVDSLAGLRSSKEIKDVEEGKDASDMGHRAKAMKSLFVALNDELGSRNITFIWTNHCMDDPSAFRPSSIQKMPGGKAVWYFTDVIIGMRRNEAKNEDSGGLKRNVGAVMPIEAVKQRFVNPFIKAQMYIDYKNGLDRYYGLFDIAKELGVITGNRSYALNDGTKLGYRKQVESDGDLWENTILPVLNPELMNYFTFGSHKNEKIITEFEENG